MRGRATVYISSVVVVAGVNLCQKEPTSSKTDGRAPVPAVNDNMVAIKQKLESYIEIGEQRPLTAGGPEFPLPPSYFDLERRDPELAMELLIPRLNSADAGIRANAYDFIGHLGELSAYRERVITLLQNAEQNDGLPVQQFVKPILRKLESTTKASTPT